MGLIEKIDNDLTGYAFHRGISLLSYLVTRVYAIIFTWTVLQYFYFPAQISSLIDNFLYFEFNSSFKYNSNPTSLFGSYVVTLITLNFISIVLPKFFFIKVKRVKVSLWKILSPLLFYVIIILLFHYKFNGPILHVTLLLSFLLYILNVGLNLIPPVFSFNSYVITLLRNFWEKLNPGFKRLHYIIFIPGIIYTILMLLSFFKKSIYGGMDAVKDYWYIFLLFIFVYIAIIWIIDGFIKNKR
tara:strand:- start:133 stop:858 length:726 start_codon:yes stop_codon:yes gene_type:complete